MKNVREKGIVEEIQAVIHHRNDYLDKMCNYNPYRVCRLIFLHFVLKYSQLFISVGNTKQG